jgi:hypothetical protein
MGDNLGEMERDEKKHRKSCRIEASWSDDRIQPHFDTLIKILLFKGGPKSVQIMKASRSEKATPHLIPNLKVNTLNGLRYPRALEINVLPILHGYI